ncbi:ABC transporter substrate-binding protein [Aquibacillus saliphilus]|uniref:ABC transporter substrate-binding protein n=1 Tax=Aquibacillus saliphilus TaxID=1909422 RepID=UPI001CF04124|nr:extracellular solute-binding protein [Aquibacillus saliphilus]
MKKILFLALLLGLFLVGCSGADDTNGEVSEDSNDINNEDSDNEDVEIRLLTRMAGSSTQVEIFNDIITKFEEDHPNVTVIDESQGDESAFNNKLKADLASGTVANIFRIQGVAGLGEYIDSGILMNMDTTLEENSEWAEGFTEGALKYYQVPGYEGTYGIPMESGLIGLYYNEALLKEAGINEFPETYSDLLVAIDKLNAKEITPISLGAGSNYMAGHLHNQIFYKWLGTDAAKALGVRDKKWTDDDVVETLDVFQELIDVGAFDPDAAGLNDEIALAEFLEGKAAMIITGPWNISRMSDPEETEFSDSYKVAKFPYFEEKPEFKDEDMQVLSPYMVNGQLEGKEKELTIELLKALTSAEASKRFAEEAQFLIPRTDYEIDESTVPELFLTSMELGSTSTGIAVDTFDFDPVASMQDRTRNSIVSLFINASPEEAAKEIQAEIDKSE